MCLNEAARMLMLGTEASVEQLLIPLIVTDCSFLRADVVAAGQVGMVIFQTGKGKRCYGGNTLRRLTRDGRLPWKNIILCGIFVLFLVFLLFFAKSR